MIKILLQVLFLFFVTGLYAQDSVIELRKEAFSLPNRSFYIDKVIDGRKIKGNIGVIKMGVWGKKIKYHLKGGLAPEVFDFLSYSFPKDTLRIPVILNVTYLNISKIKTYNAKVGRAELKVEFYRNINNNSVKLYDTKAVIDEQEFGVSNDNEGRIKKALIACLTSFNSSNWQTSFTSIAPVSKPEEKKQLVKQNEQNPASNEVLKAKRMLIASGAIGTNARSLVLTYCDFKEKGNRKWFVPFVFSIEGIKINSSYLKKYNYHDVHLYYIEPGLGILGRFSDNFTLNLAFQFPLGIEMLTDYDNLNTNKMLAGIRFSQGLNYVFNSGIILGAGIYEKYLTSMVFKQDIGFQIQIGLKF
jgi:hypothetical protein